MAPGSSSLPRSRSSLIAVQPLPIIAEDDSVPPVLPDRSSKRASAPLDIRASHNNYAPYASRSPTTTLPTTSSSAGTVPDRKPEGNGSQHLRQQEWIARRGGWYRMVLFGLILIGIIIGLAVGLTIGLRKDTSSTPSQPLSTSFPAGNYTISTALLNSSTSCVAPSVPPLWRCFPYTTYSSLAPNLSLATFFWTITPLTSWSYTISSSPNPFAPSFASLPLTLHDANQYTERLTFNFSLSKPSSTAVGAETATCWFNATVMSVTLWTRERADYPPGIGAVDVPENGTAGLGFADWPFRVEVRQVQGPGAGVPDCRGPGGESVGRDLGAGGECGCFYSNFGLSGNGTGSAVGNATGTASEMVGR